MFLEIDEAVAKFALSFGILFFFLIYFDWRERNLHPSQLQAQLSFLQSKMRPHFLFNTINSIVSLIKKEPTTAKKMLLNLSELLRASLKEEHTFMHKLSEEITLCKKYLEIEKMRLGDRLEIFWDVEENLDNVIFPKLSIQPLIENSVLHGIQKLEEGGSIHIKISKTLKSRLTIEISNPIPLETIGLVDEESHNNISMANLIERLKICFDGDILFRNLKSENKFYVYLETPIET
jgi:two-component system sensor histidine kinase AlgZ